ncbi:YggS family pyridoxal phosphate-dependent enzyme, partial [bacterium]|nr:YggS family pyridoxal phosphate-dependent enzyme [bacterium]
MSVKENLERILKDIEGYNPIVIAVTKYCGASKMKEAFDAGLRHFGENKAQDALKKIHEMDDTIKCQSIYHFIGHLQTNKVKYVVGEFEYIHSVDSLKLAHLIDDLAGKIGIKQKILVQVNNAEEPQKFGVAPKELDNLIMQIRRLNHIELKGLMNMAPLGCETSR